MLRLLSGFNGSGKSNLFNAILFVISGELPEVLEHLEENTKKMQVHPCFPVDFDLNYANDCMALGAAIQLHY